MRRRGETEKLNILSNKSASTCNLHFLANKQLFGRVEVKLLLCATHCKDYLNCEVHKKTAEFCLQHSEATEEKEKSYIILRRLLRRLFQIDAQFSK